MHACSSERGPCVWLGGAPLHHSHALRFSCDLALWFCTTCGQYASLAARGLGRPCTTPLDHRGRKNLAAIAKGEWPQDRPMPATHRRRLQELRDAAAAGSAHTPNLQSQVAEGRAGPGPSGHRI